MTVTRMISGTPGERSGMMLLSDLTQDVGGTTEDGARIPPAQFTSDLEFTDPHHHNVQATTFTVI